MDIQRKVLPRRRRWLPVLGVAAALALLSTAFLGLPGVRELPELDREQAWIGTIEYGPMAIAVRAPGRFVAADQRWVIAPSDGVVEAVHVDPGDRLEPGTVLIELTNPQLRRERLESELTLRSEVAATESLRTRLDSDILDLQASIAGLEADYREAALRLLADRKLSEDGLVSPLETEIKQLRVNELERRLEIEQERLTRRRGAIQSELAAQQVRVDKAQALLAYLDREVNEMRVRVQTPGIATEVLPEVGARVTRGDALVRVIDPTRLRVELDVPQVRASEVLVGQQVLIDTRKQTLRGEVSRIDPSVQEGVVRVEVEPIDALPSDARPELRVDGTIEIEQLGDVVFVRRPIGSREDASLSLYKIEEDSPDRAVLVDVQLGRQSVNTVQIVSGLEQGDRVILSDTSTLKGARRIRLR